MPRIYLPAPLASGQDLRISGSQARHIQVLRMQPGQCVQPFNGAGGEFEAHITEMGRNDVRLIVGPHQAIEREATMHIQLCVGMPTNERMDYLVEKATELGAAHITPLQTQRSVLKLSGERAAKKQAHWQSIAHAACEQCGRNRVPHIGAIRSIEQTLAELSEVSEEKIGLYFLSFREGAHALNDLDFSVYKTAPRHQETQKTTKAVFFSGPEGGLSSQEETLLLRAGAQAVSLGVRTLRAETAPLFVLAQLA